MGVFFESGIVELLSFTPIFRKKILFKTFHLWLHVGQVVLDLLDTPEGSEQALRKPQKFCKCYLPLLSTE